MNAEGVRATDTARMLVSCYLDDGMNVHAAIREVMETESRARLCRLLWVLVGALGDTYDDLDDFSAFVLRALADQEGDQ